MANEKLLDQPELIIPTVNTLTYAVETAQSYKMPVSTLATTLINAYDLVTNTLAAPFMSAANAEIILAGLNNASTSMLSADRVDLTNLFFDIDGGNFFDTYVNTSTFDGGTI
jgi:hypothetical protein